MKILDDEKFIRNVERLTELILVTELGYSAGYTASDLGGSKEYVPGVGLIPFGPGSFIPNSIYANVGRCLTGENVFREVEIMIDISGGIGKGKFSI